MLCLTVFFKRNLILVWKQRFYVPEASLGFLIALCLPSGSGIPALIAMPMVYGFRSWEVQVQILLEQLMHLQIIAE